jgi:type IV pilus assembly protein PilM
MLNSKYRYPIAIDIGNEQLCAVQLKETRKGLAVRGLFHQEFAFAGEAESSEETAAVLLSVLKEISKSNQFHGKRVAAHLPSWDMVSFPIRFQVGREETMEGAILRESKAYLPFPLENAVIDYPSIMEISSGAGNQYKATVTATRMDHLQNKLLTLKQAGLNLDVVDFAVSSLFRLHQYLLGAPENPVILCHIDQTQTLITVMKEDGILGERLIPWGINFLLKRIQENMELKNDRHKSRILLKHYGLNNDNPANRGSGEGPAETDPIDTTNQIIYQIITPYIEELIDEFHKMIGYARSEETNIVFEGLYLYGQGILIRNLDGYIEKRLGIQTKTVDPMEVLELSGESIPSDFSEDTSFALAMGLAMRKVTWL